MREGVDVGAKKLVHCRDLVIRVLHCGTVGLRCFFHALLC